MSLRSLPPELIAHLLEGEEDALTEPQRQRIARIKETACPRCGASLHPRLNAKRVFVPSDPLPRYLAVCSCGFEMDAQSGIILDRGKATQVEDPVPLLRTDE